jgi:hypothetical protein
LATLSQQQITAALTRLGELAIDSGDIVELILLGGGLMVLLFGERDSTRDLDVLIVGSAESAKVREFAGVVAAEHDWPNDWLNDAAKGYLVGLSEGPVVFSAPGIIVRRPAFAQLLAMKLSAWRDELDITDARRLLRELAGEKEIIWQEISPYLIPGSELKARYAFDDLWETTYGTTS